CAASTPRPPQPARSGPYETHLAPLGDDRTTQLRRSLHPPIEGSERHHRGTDCNAHRPLLPSKRDASVAQTEGHHMKTTAMLALGLALLGTSTAALATTKKHTATAPTHHCQLQGTEVPKSKKACIKAGG